MFRRKQTNVHFDNIEDYRDVEVFNVQKEYLERGMPASEFLSLVHDNGRDNVRTPMQWDETKNVASVQESLGLPLTPIIRL